VIPVLFVTGPVGVGKTAVLYEADALLVDAGIRHATVELEEIARCWTEATQESRVSFVYQNLAALWSNFAAVGATRLLLSGLVGHRQEVERVSHAVPGALVTIARLHAPLAVLEQRIRRREAASPDGELDGARWWTRHFEAEHPEDYLVETHERPVREIAVDVLRRAGWLTEPGRRAPSALSASRLSARRSDQPQ
jgi:chloramphenicol 3-O-phosphotransferase